MKPIQCNKCKTTFPMDTNGEMLWCSCGAIAVDSNELLQKIIGDHSDWQEIVDHDLFE